jgi:hemerythrin-like domain-containing protein
MEDAEDVSPTELLRRDHRVIGRVLDGLEAVSGSIMNGGEVPVDTLTRMVMFSQTFVDGCHHGKEESCLFPCLERKGIPNKGGPIEVMLYEHQVGRDLVAKIQAEMAKRQDAGAKGAELSRLCMKYVSHLRQHILKEESVLFWMGDRAMNDEDRAGSLTCFEQTEEEKVGKGKHEEMLKLAGELGSTSQRRRH